MSRGYWNYQNENLKREIFEEVFHSGKPKDVFEDYVMSELVYDVFDFLYAADSYKCGDWGEEEYRQVITKFKEKWLFKDGIGKIQKEIVDRELEDLKTRLYNSLEIE